MKSEDFRGKEPEILMEITTRNLLSDGELDLRDFLDRVDLLGALGRTVLISNYAEYHQLVNYLTRITHEPIGLPLGIPALHEIFQEQYYQNLDGGILEGLGRLFKAGVKLYVYPIYNPKGELVTAENFRVAPKLRHLYAHLLENGFIVPLEGYHTEYLSIRPKKVIQKLREGDDGWQSMVPAEVAQLIRERGLFGYRELETASRS